VALSSTRRFAPLAAALIALVQVVLAPVQWLLAELLVNPIVRLLAPARPEHGPVTTEELRRLVEHSAGEGVINSKENDMLQAVVGFGDVSVREVMTPRVDVQSIQANDKQAAIRRAAQASRRRRLPVCGRDLDVIKGVLVTRDLYLDPEAPIKTLIRPVHFVPEQINLVQLIRYFRDQNTHFAVVVDEYGGTAGVVAMEDVVGRIVGDLPDDDTTRPPVTTERIDQDTYRLPGNLSVRVWADRFAVGEIDRHIDTVGGLILAKLGRLPRVGDSVRIRNLTLTVEQMRKRRVEQVLLWRDGGSSPLEEAR
jgi:putative hemolysin